jgi:hypothetical protein
VSRVIPGTFFITGLGRSGTQFLASVLGGSRQWWVVHEWKLRPIYHERRLKHFPVERFALCRYLRLRRGYGEVNSHLRRVIGVDQPGTERFIERRGLVLRDPREVLTSAMNRQERTMADLPRACEIILTGFARLRAVRDRSPLGYQVFSFAEVTRSLPALQAVVDWAGIDDVRVGPEQIARKVNVNTVSWFPPHREWTAEQRRVFDAAAERAGLTAADFTC